MMGKVLILMIRAYQVLLSPLVGRVCRFHPSCSCYCIESIRRFGAIRGLWLGLGRIGRCHPWHPGGHDPVPEAFSARRTRRESVRERPCA